MSTRRSLIDEALEYAHLAEFYQTEAEQPYVKGKFIDPDQRKVWRQKSEMYAALATMKFVHSNTVGAFFE